MLTRMTIESIRRHKHTEIALQPLTILAGPNGVGKSTVLDLLRLIFDPGLQELHPRLPTEVLRAGVKATVEPTPSKTSIRGPSQPRFRCIAYARSSKWSVTEKTRSSAAQAAPKVGFLSMQVEALKSASPLADDRQIAPNGSNLAAVLAHLTLQRDGRIEAIEADLRNIVPDASRLFTENKRGPDGEPMVELFIEFRGVGKIPASQLSNGTLLALGLLTALRMDDVTLLLLDDLEHGMHMDAQRTFMDALRAVMAQKPELQVVISTHSPFIMEGAKPEEIVLFGMGEDGTTVAAGLTEHPESERLLKLLTPAEMWTSVAEDWIGKRPA